MQHSTGYTVLFAAAVCGVCSILVSGSFVSLEERQIANATLDRQKQVLTIAGLMKPGESIDAEQAGRLFDSNVDAEVVDLQTGVVSEGISADTFDQLKASRDPSESRLAPDNRAKVLRLPNNGMVYRVVRDGKFESVIVPISGQGLWSTLYGYIALAADGRTINGITFYAHGETPGLGGEIDNPSWKALWVGRKAFDKNWKPQIWLTLSAAQNLWVTMLCGVVLMTRALMTRAPMTRAPMTRAPG